MSKNENCNVQALVALLTRPQVASLIQCSARKVDELRRSGRLPSFKIGSLVRFKKADVEHFIESSKFTPANN